jgi:hypothetical protein
MKTPFSVRVIVALEWLLCGLMGFYSLMFAVFGIYGLIHLDFARVLSSMSVAMLMAAIATGAFFAGSRLRRGERRAWIASWCVGIMVMSFGWFALREGLHRAGHDNYFGLIVGPVLVAAALLGIVLLVLPQTRLYCDPAKHLNLSP